MTTRRITSYRDLKVWEAGMNLVAECYGVSRELPRTELYGLMSQIQRSAVSVPANIAEGYGRRHIGDYLRHLLIANGSLKELETEVLIAVRLGYLSASRSKPILDAAEELGRMLAALIRGLKRSSNPVRPKT